MNIQELSLPDFDPLEFFSKLGKGEEKATYFTSGKWTIVTWNPTKMIRVENGKIFDALRKANERRRNNYDGELPFIGGIIGTLDYEAERRGGTFHEYDEAVLWNGKKVVAVGERKFLGEVRAIHKRYFQQSSPPAPLLQQERGDSCYFHDERSFLRRSGERCPAGRSEDRLQWRYSITRSQYARAFKAIQKDIQNGEYYQLNLTYTLETDFNDDRRQLFCDLLRTNPASCAAYFEDGDSTILSLSPERFVTIDKGMIVTCPIKGTRPRGKTAAEDAKLRNELLKSEKEEAELNMITDLLRNDIGKVSNVGSVKVREHRALQKNPTVWHTYSVIAGKLLPNLHPVQALRSMSPGGSITGCPKRVTMQRIQELEKRERGSYCGSMVMLCDSSRLDSTILIRTIVAKGKRLSLGIGGGIVADSKLEEEWQETKQKARAFETLGLGMGFRVWANGQKISDDDPRLSLLNPANPDAYGVFETMRVENGIVCDLEDHLERLQQSAKLIDMKLPHSIQKIAAWIQDIPQPSSLTQTLTSRLKLVCTPDNVLIEIRPLTIHPHEKTGITATFIQCQRALPEGKILPYHHEWAAHEKARRLGYDEALLVNDTGPVPEAATANIFWVDDGILHTADERMLRGITRAQVLSIAKKIKIPIQFSLPTKADLLHSDEVFLTKSTTGITPLLRIEKTSIGSGKVGILTRKLMRAFELS